MWYKNFHRHAREDLVPKYGEGVEKHNKLTADTLTIITRTKCYRNKSVRTAQQGKVSEAPSAHSVGPCKVQYNRKSLPQVFPHLHTRPQQFTGELYTVPKTTRSLSTQTGAPYALSLYGINRNDG